jgi:hypothetical protein
MGGASSKASSTIKTRSAVEALTENIMNCQANAFVTQRFVVSGNYNVISGVKQVQYMKLSSSCWQDASNIAEMQQSVANALKQVARSQSVSVLGALGKSDSEISSYITNEVTQKITQRTIQNIVNDSNVTQEILIEGDRNIIDNLSQEQTANIVFDNAQKALNTLVSVQTIENAADQEAEATQTNFVAEIIDSVFGGIGSLMLTWVIVAAIALFGGFVMGPKKIAGLFVKECDESSSLVIEEIEEIDDESQPVIEAERLAKNQKESLMFGVEQDQSKIRDIDDENARYPTEAEMEQLRKERQEAELEQ